MSKIDYNEFRIFVFTATKNMQTLDIILSCILGYGFIKGLWKGFFYELASFLSLMIGIYITIHFSEFVKNRIEVWFHYQSEYINIISFVITFALTVIGILFLAKFFTKVAYFASLGLINTLFGGLFGLLKMMLFVSVLLNFFVKLNKKEGLMTHQKLEESVLFEPVISVSREIYPLLEEWFPEVMQAKEDFKKAI